jgi:hypothetical protein
MIDNLIWTDRGIIISLIYLILKKYSYISEKYIIIRQNRIRNFLKFLFPKLNFISNEKERYNGSFTDSESEDDHKNYFYIYIRNRPNSGDNNCIVVDYLSNYNKNIPTNEIWIVPYYDKNDPLIFYYFDKDNQDEYLEILNQYKIINDFTINKRNNYKKSEDKYNGSWDLFFEGETINRFLRNGSVQKSITLNSNPNEEFMKILNKYLNNVNFLNDYTVKKNDKVDKKKVIQEKTLVPVPIFIPQKEVITNKSNEDKKIEKVNDDIDFDNLNEFVNILNDKVENVIKILD